MEIMVLWCWGRSYPGRARWGKLGAQVHHHGQCGNAPVRLEFRRAWFGRLFAENQRHVQVHFFVNGYLGVWCAYPFGVKGEGAHVVV